MVRYLTFAVKQLYEVIHMQKWLTTLLILTTSGIIGQTSRILLQLLEYGIPPKEEAWKIWVKLTLGAVGGWITWEIVNSPIEAIIVLFPSFIAELTLISRLFAFTMGFTFPDILENLALILTKWVGEKE